jgi:hypothetical protein
VRLIIIAGFLRGLPGILQGNRGYNRTDNCASPCLAKALGANVPLPTCTVSIWIGLSGDSGADSDHCCHASSSESWSMGKPLEEHRTFCCKSESYRNAPLLTNRLSPFTFHQSLSSPVPPCYPLARGSLLGRAAGSLHHFDGDVDSLVWSRHRSSCRMSCIRE